MLSKEGIEIKANSPEYRIWIRRRDEKNLIRRTKKKAAIRARRTREIAYNTKLKTVAAYNRETRNYEFPAPLSFSFISNPVETSTFFNDVIAFITNRNNYGKRLYIDISRIKELSIDALMYLLAIVNNLSENFKNRFSFSGNAPADANIRKLFSESGFYSFVNYQGTEPLTKNSDTVQIVSGNNSDTELAKRMSDFVSEKAGIPKKACHFLYIMMIELMSNTHKHAYNDNEVLYPRWYCFGEYKKNENTISFTFMDTGEGIPATVRKNFAEKLDFLKIKGENRYVISALNGDFRTATNQCYRGKGLPKIREFCSDEKIQNMRIITNKADVTVNQNGYESSVLSVPLQGTLYYWQINIADIRGA